jgi:hypothetical protein
MYGGHAGPGSPTGRICSERCRHRNAGAPVLPIGQPPAPTPRPRRRQRSEHFSGGRQPPLAPAHPHPAPGVGLCAGRGFCTHLPPGPPKEGPHPTWNQLSVLGSGVLSGASSSVSTAKGGRGGGQAAAGGTRAQGEGRVGARVREIGLRAAAGRPRPAPAAKALGVALACAQPPWPQLWIPPLPRRPPRALLLTRGDDAAGDLVVGALEGVLVVRE